MTHITTIEASKWEIKSDTDFIEIIRNALEKALYDFNQEIWPPNKKIDYTSVNITCGCCYQRDTLCIEIKADDATMFKKVEVEEPLNTFEELLITIMKDAPQINRAQILQAYVQKYGPLSDKAAEKIKKLLENDKIAMIDRRCE